jgi:hypothetical protein
MLATTPAWSHCLDNILPGQSHAAPGHAACTPESEGREFAGREMSPRSGRSETASSIASARVETDRLSASRWGIAGTGVGVAGSGVTASAATESESAVQRSLDQLHFADPHDWINNPPEILTEIKNYKHQGMPIIHLMQSRDTVVDIGVSSHGKPGLYFTRKLPF